MKIRTFIFLIMSVPLMLVHKQASADDFLCLLDSSMCNTDPTLEPDTSFLCLFDPATCATEPEPLNDADNDGILDSVDNCPSIANASQTNTDADSLGNICDDDDDGDGLPDIWELAFGLDPLNPSDAFIDSDDDGVSNFDEFQAGTDPTQTAEEAQIAFIKRFYLNILNRTADQGGLTHWLSQIQSNSGSAVALGFFNSQEFINLQLNNADFVNILYKTLFDRVADQGGHGLWMTELNSGISR